MEGEAGITSYQYCLTHNRVRVIDIVNKALMGSDQFYVVSHLATNSLLKESDFFDRLIYVPEVGLSLHCGVVTGDLV